MPLAKLWEIPHSPRVVGPVPVIVNAPNTEHVVWECTTVSITLENLRKITGM